MSDWQVGDLALCVDDRPNHALGQPEVRKGQVYCVAAVMNRPDILGNLTFPNNCVGLILEGVKTNARTGAFHAARFRKIKPDAEPCEEEFTVLIKRMKPAKVKS